MKIEPVAFGGWPHCLKLANAFAELIVTLDVGPRVISYHVPHGENVMSVNPPELGGTGEPRWLARGGHRFWLAPEDERTYAPDNEPVQHEVLAPHSVRFTNPAAAPWFVRKDLTITFAADGPAVTLEHRATNAGAEPTTLATWALTVMQAGGLEIIPQPPRGEHPRDLAPDRQLVLWPYTDMSDERWRWGEQFITLRQTPHSSPTKLGLAHREKWIAYLMQNALFIKTFTHDPEALYPDFGCNFETFTDAHMLEVETLGSLRPLLPGEAIAHTETWHLFGSITDPGSLKEPALAAWLAPFLAKIQLP